MRRLRLVGLALIALTTVGITAGCDNSPASQGVILDGAAADGSPVRVLKAWVISLTDTDPGPDAVWSVVLHGADVPRHTYDLRFAGPRLSEESTSGPEFTPYPVQPYAGVGDIDHRVVGQAGIELVDTNTGAVVCAGTGASDDTFTTAGFLYLHVSAQISFHCDDPRDASNDLTMLTVGQLNYGSYGAL